MGVAHSGCVKARHDGWPTKPMSKKKLELTRRRVLGGLGTIGVASAAAGLGTSAYLNDTESFENNMMTAGELDLAVDYVVHEDQGDAGTYTINSFTGEVNDEDSDAAVTVNGDGTAMSQNLGDVKPGDSGYSRFCFEIDDNPAYMWACGGLTLSHENGYTEPEPVDGNGEGELEENIEVDVQYCEINEETGELVSTGETILSGTLREVLARLQVGLPLDGTGDSMAGGGDQSAYAGTGSDDVSSDVTNPCLCLDWEVPAEVENEIQGDELEFDLQFHALQARHNDGTANPCADFSLSTDYSTPEGHGNSTDGSVLTNADFGEENVTISFTFQDDDDGVDFLDTSDYSSTNLPMAIDADEDGVTDFQLAWQPNAGFPDDPFAYINHPSSGSKDSPEELPSGYSATKTGNTITFGMPRSVVGSDFRFFVFASTGGEGPVVEIDQNPNDGNFDFFDSSDHIEVSEP